MLISNNKGSKKLILPTNYEIINKKMPKEYGCPPDAVDYRMINDGTYGYVIKYQVTEEESIPFDNMESVIAEVREYLDDSMGLIEVKNGIAKNKGKYL